MSRNCSLAESTRETHGGGGNEVFPPPPPLHFNTALRRCVTRPDANSHSEPRTTPFTGSGAVRPARAGRRSGRTSPVQVPFALAAAGAGQRAAGGQHKPAGRSTSGRG